MDREYKKRIIIAIICFIFSLIMVVFAKVPVKTVKAARNYYEVKIPFRGIFFAPEYVLYKGGLKNINLKYKAGEKIKKGAKIAENITSNGGGLLITNLDGFENVYTLKNIKSININKIDDIIANDQLNKSKGMKILDNDNWYICAFIKNKEKQFKGSENDMLINKNYYKFQFIEQYNDNFGTYLILKLRNDLDIFDLRRGINGYIIKSRYYGILLPDKAIINNNGSLGVFVKFNGYAEFRKVKIKYRGEGIAVVDSLDYIKSIKEYDDVICNPSGIREGIKVK